MAKVVDGIKMGEVKAAEIKAIIKQFNDAKLGVSCKVGANPLGSAKAFVQAIEKVDDAKVDEIPEEVTDYYNRIVVGEEDQMEGAEADVAEADDPEVEEEAPTPKAKKAAKASKPAPAAKPKKEPKPKKEKAGPSNKFLVYKEWKKGKEKRTPPELLEFIESKVKIGTIRNWVNQWKHGKNLPAGADK